MAENDCLSMDGNLASFHTIEEYNFIRDLIYKAAKKHTETWVGGHDSAQEGYWMWTDGSNFILKSWGPLEPDNKQGKEHCLLMNSSEQDHTADEICSKKFPYVCVRSL
ncbi:galactose-specific lectin nattectin-like [Poeciliopsis prolifica]|uniref:galactose-specific lectin nattectin-like n=1 Tax=Poeciliopsis prolifica TaxID=188132 RepID=UPI00241404C7|nr:galactose-specific lectin nattectin-like [Poeciliopsis prolifica]